MKTTSLKAGFGQAFIPFLKNRPLAGYAAIRPAAGEHDPLMIQTMILADKDKTIAICSMDLLAADHLLMDAVISRLEQADLHLDEILLCSTHTHSGYAGLLDTEHGFLQAARHFAMEPDEELIDIIADQIVCSLQQAFDNMEEAKFYVSTFSAPGIASNRVDPTLTAPESGHLLKVVTEKQEAILCFFACHPTVLAPDNLQVTADFPGAARSILKKAGIRHFLYFNGASGDLSCRYTRKESSFEECERLGAILGDGILEGMRAMKELPVSSFSLQTEEVTLKLKTPLDLRRAKADLEEWTEKEKEAMERQADPKALREIRSCKEGALAAYFYANCHLKETDWIIRFSILTLGVLRFVFLPAELFSSLAKQYFDSDTIPVCCANGYNLYLADRKAHQIGTYEALSSPFEAGQAEKLMEEICVSLRSV